MNAKKPPTSLPSPNMNNHRQRECSGGKSKLQTVKKTLQAVRQ